nr:ribonuclease H-like domain-containing protein [Tanacetum cinerariifolium]
MKTNNPSPSLEKGIYTPLESIGRLGLGLGLGLANSCMWLFRHKYLADGTLCRYNARLVANGSTQIERSLYGLKQASRAWFQRFVAYITRVGFSQSRCDSSLSIYRQGNDTAYLLLYREYATEILEQAHMVGCNSSRTPVITESKLGDDGDMVSDPTLYRSLAGSLQYLTFTRPDISYAVQQVCLHMHDPREPHFSALKRILRYVRGTLDYGLQLFASSTTSLVAYSDANWVGVPLPGDRLQAIVSFLATTYSRGPLNVNRRSLVLVLSAVYLSSNPVQHQHTKHIEIDIHFVRDLVAACQFFDFLFFASVFGYFVIYPWLIITGSYRSKEDDVSKISTSIYVTNFPETFFAKDLFHSCKVYGHVVDSFIPLKRSKDGKRFGFVRFINVFSVERLVTNLCTIWVDRFKLHANVAHFNRPHMKDHPSFARKGPEVSRGSFNSTNNKAAGDKGYAKTFVNVVKDNSMEKELSSAIVLVDDCLNTKELNTSLLGRVKEFASFSNLK